MIFLFKLKKNWSKGIKSSNKCWGVYCITLFETFDQSTFYFMNAVNKCFFILKLLRQFAQSDWFLPGSMWHDIGATCLECVNTHTPGLDWTIIIQGFAFLIKSNCLFIMNHFWSHFFCFFAISFKKSLRMRIMIWFLKRI